MNTPPESPTNHDVLDRVRQEWFADADTAAYLPLGFGAHHWRIEDHGEPVLFATLDIPSGRRSFDILERAYASANALAESGIKGVIAPICSKYGQYTVSLADGVMSVTRWLNGRNPTAVEARDPDHISRLVALLRDLHRSDPLEMIPTWQPRGSPEFAESLHERIQVPWTAGPLGETARQMIVSGLSEVVDSLREYHLLASEALAAEHHWVPTHGEPHWANQLLVDGELVLVDWDTVSLAPQEIDFVDLPWSAHQELGCNESMLRMFRLEWQLMEIAEYADWFENAHAGTADDQFALEKLTKELRPI